MPCSAASAYWLGVLRQELRPVQPPLRIARDDVGEGPAPVDPEVPARHRSRPPAPSGATASHGRPPPDASTGRLPGESLLCAAAARLLVSCAHVDLDPHHRGDRRPRRPRREPAARLRAPAARPSAASPSPSPSSASAPRWPRPTGWCAPPRSPPSARSSRSRRGRGGGGAGLQPRAPGRRRLRRLCRPHRPACSAAGRGCSRTSSRASSTSRSPTAATTRARRTSCAPSAELFGVAPRPSPRSRPATSRAGAAIPGRCSASPRDADLATVRARWRELVRAHHPDKMIARGLPPETVNLANARLAQINHAWEEISARLRAAAAAATG